MSYVEKISLGIASKLGNKLNKNEEEVAVLNYGLFFMIHTTMAIIMTFIVGVVFNILLEIMLISITTSLLKRYSGGVHASTPNRCILSGLILSLIISFTSRYIASNVSNTYLIVFVSMIIIISSIVIYKKCPVPSENKPLKKESTRKKLRIKSFKLIFIYILLIIGLFIYHKVTGIYIMKLMVVSISMGIMLQIIAMTKIGEILINYFEKIFNFVNFK